MPTDAPAVKRAATEAYGATIVPYDRDREDREAIGRRIAAERGLTIVPPYDHPHIVAGAGTAARELIEEVGPLDLLLVPCGGGGLLSGSALAARAMAPQCRVVGVEPAAADDATRSFRTKTLHRVDNPKTIADGARTPSLGTITFPLVLANVSDMTAVDDESLIRAMFYLWERLKLVVEPTGALAAAALLETSIAGGAERVGVILSGGNVDFSEIGGWLARLPAVQARLRESRSSRAAGVVAGAAARGVNASTTGSPSQSVGSGRPSSHRTVDAVSIVRIATLERWSARTPLPQAIQGIVTSRGSSVPWPLPWPP